ncbi:MAG: hypothetical protein ACFNOO_01450 [Segatella oulorum]
MSGKSIAIVHKGRSPVALLSKALPTKGMNKRRYLQRHSLQKAWTSGATFKGTRYKGHKQAMPTAQQDESNVVSTIAFAS